MDRRIVIQAAAAFGLVFFLLSASVALAAPVSSATAARAVQGWLGRDHGPLASRLPGKIKRTDAVKNKAGETLYYVVRLKPSGYVIVSADDSADPVVAFSPTGSFDSTSASPVTSLVNRDLPRRLAKARARRGAAAPAKWSWFLAGSANPPPDSELNGSIVAPWQIWVAPLVQTLWNQTVDVGLNEACYNYFTPPGASGDTNNYPCGCVATAMAQEMFYFQYPTAGVGTASFPITVNGVASNVALFGGPYQWTNMPLSPNDPISSQAMAIGALTHDAGVSVQMEYTAGNSAAYTANAPKALTNTFLFSGAGYFEDDANGISGSNLLSMINPSLDAHIPVMLGIEPNGGHCLLVDGYGYAASTLFHHVNAGFGGDDDVWYALPNIDTVDGNGDYTTVVACVYNIFTNGTGQIISGRVTDATGAPVAGATVTAVKSGGGSYSATTDSNGVYALARIPVNSTYTLTASNAGVSAAMGAYATGASVYDQLPSGNVWGANVVLTPTLLAVPETGFAAIGPVGGPFSMTSKIFTLTNSAAPSVAWTISNTNTWLTVSSTNGSLAAGVASNLTIALAPAATNLAAGTHSGSVWITNLSDGRAQQLAFSVSVETADYPMAVTGYNLDVIVENTAVGGNTENYAASFDPADFNVSGPVCFYETGLVATNLAAAGALASKGLPTDGLITSLVDGVTTFQLGPYAGSNVLYLTSGAPSGTLAFSSPTACKSLSILAASAQGGGNGSVVLNFAGGAVSTNLSIDAADYLVTNSPGPDAALTNFGLLVAGAFNEYYSVDSVNNLYPFPTLYQTTINLHALGYDTNPILSAVFHLPTGAGTTTNTVTGIFAVSGTAVYYTGNDAIIVGAFPAGGGVVAGGGFFAPGSTNTVTATANPGYTFVNWTQGGIVVSTSPQYTFVVNNSATLMANFLSPQFSLAANASPLDGGSISGAGTFPLASSQTLTATAASGFAFAAWTGDASGTNNPLTVTMTTNLNITANFVSLASNFTLTLSINNNLGFVYPNPNGKTYRKNQLVTLTAIPNPGNLFAGWTGSVTTNRNPLSIKMDASKVLEAIFLTNIFLPAKGSYNGLFTGSNAVIEEQSAGMLKGFTLGTKGTYSGTLLVNGAGHGFSGTFTAAGFATNRVVRSAAQGGPLTLQLTFNPGPPPQVTGVVTASNWVSTNLMADLASKLPFSAEYTLSIPPDTNNTASNAIPSGDGYAVITNHVGAVKITGALADGTAFSQSVPASPEQDVPVYASLYGNKGLLLGWINLDASNAPGTLYWVRPTKKTGLFTNTFTSTNGIVLSGWTNPPLAGVLPTNLLIGSNVYVISITKDKVEKVSGPETLSGTLNPRTGLLTLTAGTGASKQTGSAVLLPATTNGAGFFLTKTNAGAIQLAP